MLGDYLKHTYTLSKRAVKRRLDRGLVSVNGKVERFYKTALQPEDCVELQSWSTTLQAFDPTLVLFEDPYFLVYDKPVGVISDGPSFLRSLDGLSLCHRLDRDTSGCLLLAKTEMARQKMEALFRRREVIKQYVALLSKALPRKEGTIEAPIGVVYKEGSARRFGVQEGGKQAITDYKAYLGGVHLYPKTGRTHQLRVHMAHLGAPIVGDILYGRESVGKRLFLHAEQLTWKHPFLHTWVTAKSIVPFDIPKNPNKEI